MFRPQLRPVATMMGFFNDRALRILFQCLIYSVLNSNIQATAPHSVRLVNGPSSNQGRVEIYNAGIWGTVCDDQWDLQNGHVVCRQLGFTEATQIVTGTVMYGAGTSTIWLDDVICDGAESTLASCSHRDWGDNNCAHSEDVGVVCKTLHVATLSPGTARIRLVDGPSSYEGRLEVFHEGEWGNVCDDRWSIENADVVCRQLGLFGALHLEPAAWQLEGGSGTILLDDVNCRGTESALDECSSSGWGIHDCSHSEDVGVKCSDVATAAPHSVRLVNGPSSNQGRVEIYNAGIWGTVCDDQWDLQNGHVVCRQLGFTEATQIITSTVLYGEGTTTIWLDDVNCDGAESTLASCSHRDWGDNNCVHSEDVGVVCKTLHVATLSPGNASIRLVDGPSSYEGRLEVFHEGEWGNVCDDSWSIENADVVCRQLGLFGALHLEPAAGQYEAGSGTILLDDVNCRGTESALDECSSSGWGIHDCSHSEDVGVKCSDVGIRLVDGSSYMEGRVEILYNGLWGSICDDGWDLNEGMVVCRQLGLGIAVGAPPNAQFGEGAGPILLDEIQCSGDELEISECISHSLGVHNCQHSEDAGVICQVDEGITTTDHPLIRLVDGTSVFEGRVEIFYNREWGTVCDDNWTIEDGYVACRQLGYGDAISVETFFGPGTGRILLDELDCTGTESKLELCKNSGWTNHDCGHAQDAGVVCKHPGVKPTPVEFSVRLVDGATASEGRVEIYHEGNWGTVCDDGWDIEDGNVVCRQLGYPGANGVKMDSYFGQFSGETIWLDDVTCTGVETGLDECTHNEWGIHNCDHREDAGVECVTEIDTSISTEVPVEAVRLVGGSSIAEGRVEIYISGQWSTVCAHGWDLMDATVLCHQLGYGDATRADGGASFGQGTGNILLDNVRCAGNEASIADCPSDAADNQNCNHGQDAGAVCGISEPNSHVRMVGGFTPNEGRVEIFHDGVWGSICDVGWDVDDAQVMCLQLGFDGAVMPKYNAFHGQGSGPVLLANIACEGSESEISACQHPGWYQTPSLCSHNRDAGVVCRVGTSDGFLSVRLTNLNNIHNTLEGRLEVYHHGIWGTVCSRNFDLNAASVVCRQLGFVGASATRNLAYYGEGTGPVHLSNIDCRGHESDLGNCPHSEGNLKGCTHAEDAGVMCLSTESTRLFPHFEIIVGASIIILLFVTLLAFVIICWRCKRNTTNEQQPRDSEATSDQPPLPMHRLPRRQPSLPNKYDSYQGMSATHSPYEYTLPKDSCATYYQNEYESMNVGMSKQPPPYSHPIGDLPEYSHTLDCPTVPPLLTSPDPKYGTNVEGACGNNWSNIEEINDEKFLEDHSIYQEVDHYMLPNVMPKLTDSDELYSLK